LEIVIKTQEIFDGELLLAKVIKKNALFDPGLSFLSDEKDPIQVGVWNHPAGTILQPHIHNICEKVANRTCEVLIVSNGSIHVDIYGYSEILVSEFDLFEGDILICLAGGHGYKILERDTLVFEIKNGPYPGPEIDRTRIQTMCKIASSEK
jgi:hypothetical protein